MVSWEGARISLSRGSVLSREYFPSSNNIYTALSPSCAVAGNKYNKHKLKYSETNETNQHKIWHLLNIVCVRFENLFNRLESVSGIVTDVCVGVFTVPSVLWRCWLDGRKGIRPVKNWAVGCWWGYLSGARCWLASGPADATATHCLLLQ